MAGENYTGTGGTYSALFEVAEQKKLPPTPQPMPRERTQNIPKETKQPSNHATVKPRYRDTMQPRHHDTDTNDSVEAIRKAVKQLGKEAATYRFTLDEKSALADIVYNLKTKGIRSSENELTRIAINYLVWEYRHDKQSSILSRVLERLNS